MTHFYDMHSSKCTMLVTSSRYHITTRETELLLDMIKKSLSSAEFSGNTYGSDAKIDALKMESTCATGLTGEVYVEKRPSKNFTVVGFEVTREKLHFTAMPDCVMAFQLTKCGP